MKKYKDIKVKKYKYERVLQEEATFKLPLKPLYLFQFGKRISIRIIPNWTSWNKGHYNKEEEVWKLNITVVDCGIGTHSIKKTAIQVSQIEQILNIAQGESYDLLSIIDDYESHNVRTKEDFDIDLNNALKGINDGT